jgi:hypothetical protein
MTETEYTNLKRPIGLKQVVTNLVSEQHDL